MRLSGGLDYDGFAHADVVIEAVPEHLNLKQKVISELRAEAMALLQATPRHFRSVKSLKGPRLLSEWWACIFLARLKKCLWWRSL